MTADVIPHYTLSTNLVEVQKNDAGIYFIELVGSSDPLYANDIEAQFVSGFTNCSALSFSLESPRKIMLVYDPSKELSSIDVVVNITTNSHYRKSLIVPVRFLESESPTPKPGS